ncbi:putative transferase CAF17 homolog, mitochondrial isoform X2 [Plodia interpunctella]|uniref:putative transferase CAF17 homolog, mitochondrial isoform X2 n=1 Tax=Plodia interpunctella TaxID=58824 RepID=UPI002367D5F8|nr:putative transferase CAF17 homolog, mitochondrial isoform X2 [Plodia interpunctella]
MLLNQVNRLVTKRSLINQFFRHTHSKTSEVLYPLESRRIIQISGKDAAVFLQGLITNDMRHFDEGAQSIYTMFLNNKGRVLYDTLIHKWDAEDSFLIECDKNITSLLQKHLKMFKLKRRVDIQDMSQVKLWSLLPQTNETFDRNLDLKTGVKLYKDPRIADLGYRVLTPSSLKGIEVAERIGENVKVEGNEDGYKYLRYKLGVSEGAEDLVPATCFPLEVNCDYLHGVSFHKGCYIGQELTARVHHTGVVRKRIMPIKFQEHVNEHLDKDAEISENGREI